MAGQEGRLDSEKLLAGPWKAHDMSSVGQPTLSRPALPHPPGGERPFQMHSSPHGCHGIVMIVSMHMFECFTVVLGLVLMMQGDACRRFKDGCVMSG